MNEIDMCHVMIDMETLGEVSNSVPLSIGVVQFSLNGRCEAIYHRGISIQSCLDAGLRVTGGTVEWWMNQKDANIKAIANLLRNDCVTLKEALEDISLLVRKARDLYVWGAWGNI